METPLITIITVVLNDEKNIEETILSVLNQKYKNIIININQRTDKPKIGNSLKVNLKLIKIIFFFNI